MVRETELYNRLNVNADASADDIKRAFRKMAMKYHPDKNHGNKDAAEKFKSCSEAYEVLSNNEKRQTYDRYGMDAVMKGDGGGVNAEEIFSQFFGGGGGFGFGGRSRGPNKTPDKVITLPVKLEELYNGAVRHTTVQRKAMCSQCKGSGSKSGRSTICPICKGTGVRTVLSRFGPGMMARQQMQCTQCENGEIVVPRDRCPKCQGNKFIDTKRNFKVEIDKGMIQDKKITFANESDEAPGAQPGDLIFIVKAIKHTIFERNGIHLLMNMKIPLVNALTGFEFTIKHLDNRVIHVVNRPGDVIQPGALKELKDEGMPIFARPSHFGSLFIKFDVDFPKILPMRSMEALAANLPSAMSSKSKTSLMQSREMIDSDSSHMHSQADDNSYQAGNNPYDESDSDDVHETSTTQCRQQ